MRSYVEIVLDSYVITDANQRNVTGYLISVLKAIGSAWKTLSRYTEGLNIPLRIDRDIKETLKLMRGLQKEGIPAKRIMKHIKKIAACARMVANGEMQEEDCLKKLTKEVGPGPIEKVVEFVKTKFKQISALIKKFATGKLSKKTYIGVIMIVLGLATTILLGKYYGIGYNIWTLEFWKQVIDRVADSKISPINRLSLIVAPAIALVGLAILSYEPVKKFLPKLLKWIREKLGL